MKIFKYFALVSWLMMGLAEVRGDDLGGIGVVLGVKGTNIFVRIIIPNSPADAQKNIHRAI